MRNRKCVLLVNLGSPEKPDRGSIRKYLREFLSDSRVMDIPAAVRWALLNFIILPFRPAVIQPKYKKIWDGERFLLIRHSEDLAAALESRLGDGYNVRLAMRYGSPSIPCTLSEIESGGVSELIIVPLFPQYASATGGSVIDTVLGCLRSWIVYPQIRIISSFCNDAGFIEAWRQVASPCLEKKPGHVLFSFHGLPESHILKADSAGYCMESADCCARIVDDNHQCYRAQCFQTARDIAAALDLSSEQVSVAFQSRLGRARWIEPSTAETIENLARSGVQDLLVLCPSFVADCLETVEEIGEEERDRFISFGGQSLTLVPSLNSHSAWVEALVSLIENAD